MKAAITALILIGSANAAEGQQDTVRIQAISVAPYRDMLVAVRDKVKKLVVGRQTLVQVLAAKPSAAFDATWGKGFMKADDFVTSVFESLTVKK